MPSDSLEETVGDLLDIFAAADSAVHPVPAAVPDSDTVDVVLTGVTHPENFPAQASFEVLEDSGNTAESDLWHHYSDYIPACLPLFSDNI